MKRRLLQTLMLCLCLSIGEGTFAQSKVEKRYTYTLTNLKLDKATEGRFAPVLKAYLKEKKEAGDIYDNVKDKYKAAIKAGTITDKQATELINAKLASEARELEVRKKYQEQFSAVLKPKKVYYAFDLANEKISKIEGKD